ncbi:MAG TPA: glycoside hydrolase family 25 protein [Pseudolabrys sp.]|nr:glycoside hydrolase family 25 protein [Pseudolabrys sp.]
MTIICVDISKYQKGFNFATFKQSGGLGVIMKATESTSIKDSSYPTFRPQALAQGLKVATYHFFRSSDPAGQANYYLAYAKPDLGERVVCDWEDDKCSPDMVVTFLKTIQQARPDLQLTVYSGHIAKEKLGSSKNQWLADNTSLWVCQYTSASSPSWPTATWAQWSLWQYTDQTPAPGFSGPVDQNRFNGPDANFLAWMGPASAPAPSPEPPIEGRPIITISSDAPVQIRLGANVTVA